MLNALLVFLLYAAMLITAASAVRLLSPPDAGGAARGQALFWGSLVLSGLLMAVGLVRRRPFRSSVRIGLRSVGLTVAGILLLSAGLSLLLAPLGLSDDGMNGLFSDMLRSPLCLLLLLAVGPLAEELVFREGILRSLVAAGSRPLAACAVSALLFALAHGNPAQAFPAAVLGFVLGLLYLRTSDLRLCFSAHVANNALALRFLRFPAVGTVCADLPPLCAAGAGALLLAFGGAVLWCGALRTVFCEFLSSGVRPEKK